MVDRLEVSSSCVLISHYVRVEFHISVCVSKISRLLVKLIMQLVAAKRQVFIKICYLFQLFNPRTKGDQILLILSHSVYGVKSVFLGNKSLYFLLKWSSLAVLVLLYL